MSTYETYLRAYVRSAMYRPREPGLAAKVLGLRPGRLERSAARALGVADGLAEEPIRSRRALEEELRRLLE